MILSLRVSAVRIRSLYYHECICNILSGPQGIACYPAVPLRPRRIFARKALLTEVSGNDRRQPSPLILRIAHRAPFSGLKKRWKWGNWVGFFGNAVKSLRFLCYPKGLKHLEVLLPVSGLRELIYPITCKLCGKTDCTEQTWTRSAALRMCSLLCEMLSLSSSVTSRVTFLSFPTTAPLPFGHQ